MCICGKGMHCIATASIFANAKKDDDSNSRNKNGFSLKCKLLAIFLILTNVPVAFYTGLVHQRGTIDVMRGLEGNIVDDSNTSILFLMPCHSTPYYR